MPILNVAPIIAAAVAAAERRVVEKLRRAGALDPMHPVPPHDLDLSGIEERRLERLMEAGAVKEISRGMVFLDEGRLEIFRTERRQKVLRNLIVVFVLLAFAIFLLTR
jgi:hypothetical protein